MRKISRKTKQLGYDRPLTRQKIYVHQPHFVTSFIDPAIRKFCTPLKEQPSTEEKIYGLDYVGGFISRLGLWGKKSGHVGIVSKTWVSVIPYVIFQLSFARCSARLYKKPDVKFIYTSYQTKHTKI